LCVVSLVSRWPAQAMAAEPLLDVFPPSVVEVQAAERGETTITRDYRPSGSVWAEGLDERQVFLAELAHRQGKDDSFALRVGQGGQIYSLRGAFGESVPPSWRDAGSHRSPWNDEVWQFVTVCTTYNGVKALLNAGPVSDAVQERFEASPFESSFFIHNSGAYIPGESAVQSLYCPLLAFEADAEARTIRALNWGLVPQVRTIHRSPVLYYGQVHDVGDGIIELTWVVHNFSTRDDVVFDHLNAPWGGTRHTSLPVHAIAAPGGEPRPREAFFPPERPDQAIDVQKTGGWTLASAAEAADSPSLALVFGLDRHLEQERAKAARGEPSCQHAPSLIRDFLAHYPQLYEKKWRDWQTRPENSFRNYDVIEMIPRLRIAPQQTLWFRSFLVVNRRDRAIELSQSLVDKVDYGLLTFDPATTPLVPVHVADGRVVDPEVAQGAPAFEVYARPVPDSLPVFLLEDTATGREVVSTDPYRFVPQEPVELGVPADHPHHDYYSKVKGISLDRHTSKWKRLLGYGLRTRPKQEGFMPLSMATGPNLFPKADAHHVDVWVKAATPLAASTSLPENGWAAARRQILAIGDLTKAPAMELAEGYAGEGALRAISYDAVPWKGKPTKVFAWLGLPANATGKVPGIVLVHGGGGSAFKEWVRRWNEHGFAAISISVEGQTDGADPELPQGTRGYRRHAWAGPQRSGIYGDSAEPLTDQWIYHAVADTVLANSLLRSLPEVDADKVGVMGISWGGVITATIIGIDDRFAVAIPRYGCGKMYDAENHYGGILGTNRLYREAWDPMIRMDRVRMPVLWFSWPQDKHFPLDCQAACYRSAAGPHMVSLVPGMGHGHDFRAPQPYAFAESIVREGKPWCVQAAAAVEGDAVRVEFSSTKPLDRATLVTTADGGFTGDRTWTVSPAGLEQRGDRWLVAASLPAGTTAWFVNVHHGELVASSDYQERN
ncbi:MAG: alpha/beta hydrolase family protein, partial [Planctomycetia bacterium]